MGRPKGSKNKEKKDEFADLPAEWKDAVAGMDKPAIDARIAEVAKAEEENQKLKGDDEDLKSRQLEAREAGKQYSDGTKANKLKIRFAMRVLRDKGLA
jgi:hypothetical protein